MSTVDVGGRPSIFAQTGIQTERIHSNMDSDMVRLIQQTMKKHGCRTVAEATDLLADVIAAVQGDEVFHRLMDAHRELVQKERQLISMDRESQRLVQERERDARRREQMEHFQRGLWQLHRGQITKQRLEAFVARHRQRFELLGLPNGITVEQAARDVLANGAD